MKYLSILLLVLLFVSPAFCQPNVTQWEQNMIQFGRRHCDLLKNSSASFDSRLNAAYYDGISIYSQIRDYTKDASWTECIDAAAQVYKTGYVLKFNGNVPGYWNFTTGLSSVYRDASTVKLLSEQAAFARDSTTEDIRELKYSREVAYALRSYLEAEKLGIPRRSRLPFLLAASLGHLSQFSDPQNYVKPFFIALTISSLIQYDEQIGDGLILPAVKQAADLMWVKTWKEDSQSMLYISKAVPGEDPAVPAPDLNLLIAPVYGWLYMKTGAPVWAERFDKLWNGGVSITEDGCGFKCIKRGAYIASPKTFNENYRWSIQGLAWRMAR